MRREYGIIVFLMALFVVVGLIAGTRPPSTTLSYDSRSNEPNGLRALYLTLEELGFQTRRKTSDIGRLESGVILVFGESALTAESKADLRAWTAKGNVRIVVDGPGWYTNESISTEAVQSIVEELWPYREMPIWFDEYGRGGLASTAPGETPVSMLPDWLVAMFTQIGLAVLLILLLWGVRVGPPKQTELSTRRSEQEDVQALAALMARSHLTGDALSLCYEHLTKSTKERFPTVEAALASASNHNNNRLPDAHALALAAEMDRLREESNRL